MDPERIEPDPRELDALQRAAESVADIEDSPTPETVSIPEIPTAAEQPDPVTQPLPDFTQDIQAPEVAAPILDDEVMRPILDEIPEDPKRRKLSAQQKRNGQVEPQAEQFAIPPEPDQEDHPRQQPPEPVGPDPAEIHNAARRMGAIDDDGVVDFRQADVFRDEEGADATKQAEIQAEKAVQDKIIGIDTTRLQIMQEFGARLDKLEAEYRRLLNGNMRRRA